MKSYQHLEMLPASRCMLKLEGPLSSLSTSVTIIKQRRTCTYREGYIFLPSVKNKFEIVEG
jgi:hypothetical protein